MSRVEISWTARSESDTMFLAATHGNSAPRLDDWEGIDGINLRGVQDDSLPSVVPHDDGIE